MNSMREAQGMLPVGGVDVVGDYAIARMDADGRIYVVCPHCRAEGKAERDAFGNAIPIVDADFNTVGWKSES